MIELPKLFSRRAVCGIDHRDRYYLMTFLGQDRGNVNRERLCWSEGYRERERMWEGVWGGGEIEGAKFPHHRVPIQGVRKITYLSKTNVAENWGTAANFRAVISSGGRRGREVDKAEVVEREERTLEWSPSKEVAHEERRSHQRLGFGKGRKISDVNPGEK